MDEGLLAGRRAFITGAAAGIGAATARRFCEEDARVVLADLDYTRAVATATSLDAAGYYAVPAEIDVRDESSVAAAIDSAATNLGGLDTVIANAGVLAAVDAIADVSLDAFQSVLQVNLVGVFLTLKHAVRHLRAAGGGVLVCTASQAGLRGVPELGAYTASKFGVVGLVQSVARELAVDGIRVCAVAPGLVSTRMNVELIAHRARLWHADRSDVANRLVEEVPFRRLAAPEEVADALVFLASPLARYISGVTVPVDAAELSA